MMSESQESPQPVSFFDRMKNVFTSKISESAAAEKAAINKISKSSGVDMDKAEYRFAGTSKEKQEGIKRTASLEIMSDEEKQKSDFVPLSEISNNPLVMPSDEKIYKDLIEIGYKKHGLQPGDAEAWASMQVAKERDRIKGVRQPEKKSDSVVLTPVSNEADESKKVNSVDLSASNTLLEIKQKKEEEKEVNWDDKWNEIYEKENEKEEQKLREVIDKAIMTGSLTSDSRNSDESQVLKYQGENNNIKINIHIPQKEEAKQAFNIKIEEQELNYKQVIILEDSESGRSARFFFTDLGWLCSYKKNKDSSWGKPRRALDGEIDNVYNKYLPPLTQEISEEMRNAA